MVLERHVASVVRLLCLCSQETVPAVNQHLPLVKVRHLL